jgi:hypothetical protein
MSHSDWPATQKNGTLEAPQNRVLFGRRSTFPFTPTIELKEDNLGQSIWDKTDVSLGTFGGTHWELSENIRRFPSPTTHASQKKKLGPLGRMLHNTIG